MADTVVQFANQTGITYSALQSGVTLVTNAASEQAVVKDVEISNPGGNTLNLSVGDRTVATTSGTSVLSGTELIGASSSMVLSTPSLPLYNGSIGFSNSSGSPNSILTYTAPTTVFSEVRGQSYTFADTGVASTQSFTTTPFWACFDASGNFWYSSYMSGPIYRRAGGMTGTQTQTTSGGLATCFDGRYIYGFENGNTIMYVFDTTSATPTTAIFSSSVSGMSTNTFNTNSATAAGDGFVFVAPNGGGDAYIIRPDRTAIGINSMTGWDNATRSGLGVMKNSSGEYILFRSGFESGGQNAYFRLANLGNDTTRFTTPASGSYIQAEGFQNLQITNSSNQFWTANTNFIQPILPTLTSAQSTIGRFCKFTSSQNSAYVIDSDSWNAGISNNTPYHWALNWYGGGRSKDSWTLLTVDQTRLTTDFGTVSVRATGIKTT